MFRFALIASAVIAVLAAAFTFGAAATSAVLYACHPECSNCDLVMMLSRRYASVIGNEANFSGIMMRERCGIVIPVQWHLREVLLGLGMLMLSIVVVPNLSLHPTVRILGWGLVLTSIALVVFIIFLGLLSIS